MTDRFTRNLSRHEFACKCGCGFDTVDYKLVIGLQNIVDHFQTLMPDADICIHINSGCRCKAHNKTIGGGAKSQHMLGKAADFYLYDRKTGKKIDPNKVYIYLVSHFPTSRGVGKYNDFTHYDVREDMARW